MADTFIQVATDGSGKKLDTRTEATNAEHRQVVVLGDPSTNAGVAPVDGTTGLAVNVTNASLTVGTHAVTQSGTWTVQPGNTANSTAWKVDGSAVTQPVSGTVAASSITTSVTPGTAAANLGKAEDAGHTSGDTGVMSLAVRNDTAAALAGTTLDYIPITTNARGATWIAIEDGSGGQVTSFSGPTQYTEDVAAASDPVGSMLMAVRRDTLSTSEVSADGDNIALKASNKGKLHVAAETRFGDTVADLGTGTGGTATQRVIIDSNQLGPAPTAAQAMATAGYVLTGIVSDQVKIPVHGNTAHDGVDADKPIKTGGFAKAAAPADVSADGDVVNSWYLRNGAAATVITAAGALVGGDAANGLDVDVTRLPSQGFKTSATFTCGTTAYAVNDAVGASGANAALTFANAGAGAGEYMITSAALEIDTTAIISGETSYRLYLYNVTPPSATNDSAAWDLPSGDRASFLGFIDLGAPADLGSTLYCEVNGINKQLTLASSSVFGYLTTVGAYTPTARVFLVTLHTVQV